MIDVTSEWAFLIDENLEPRIATYLKKEGIAADHVLDALFEGADDRDDILPYLREHDRIFVTNDVTDFSTVPDTAHEGIIILYDGKRPAFEITGGILDVVDVYPDRDSLRGYEILDDWL